MASITSGRVARAVQPVPHRAQVVRAAHGDALAAEPAPDLGDVGRREPDRVQRIAVRPEVVHLGAVGLVVVDHDHHGQAEPDHGLQLADAHQRPAVAQRRDRQPVRPGDRGADGRGQAEPDRLVGLGEAEPVGVGHGQVHARVAHEVARVHGHDPLGREQVVELDRQGARVDPAAVAVVVVGHVPPADLGGDPVPQRRRPVARLAAAAWLAVQQLANRPRGDAPRRRSRRAAPAGARRSRPARGRPGPRPRPGRSACRAAASTCSASSPSRRPGRRRGSARRPAARRSRR